MTEELEKRPWFVEFLDKIWLQFGIALVITFLWLTWIFYEIYLK